MQAQAELQSISLAAWRHSILEPISVRIALVKGLQDTIVKGTRSSLLVLAGAVACLLLDCMRERRQSEPLARATLRSKDFAVRTAIGASRYRYPAAGAHGERSACGDLGGVSQPPLAVWGTDFLLAHRPARAASCARHHS